VGHEDDAVAQERNAGAAGHDPFLELQVRDPAFVDAGVERGGDSLYDCRLVFASSTPARRSRPRRRSTTSSKEKGLVT
jgi:hypothetical protein